MDLQMFVPYSRVLVMNLAYLIMQIDIRIEKLSQLGLLMPFYIFLSHFRIFKRIVFK